MKSWRGCSLVVREGDRQETLTEWYAIRSDTRQREKLRCAIDRNDV